MYNLKGLFNIFSTNNLKNANTITETNIYICILILYIYLTIHSSITHRNNNHPATTHTLSDYPPKNNSLHSPLGGMVGVIFWLGVLGVGLLFLLSNLFTIGLHFYYKIYFYNQMIFLWLRVHLFIAGLL